MWDESRQLIVDLYVVTNELAKTFRVVFQEGAKNKFLQDLI